MIMWQTVLDQQRPCTKAGLVRVSANSLEKLGDNADRAETSMAHSPAMQRLEAYGGAEAVIASTPDAQRLRDSLGIVTLRRRDVHELAEKPGQLMGYLWPMPDIDHVLVLLADSAALDNVRIPGDLPRNCVSEFLVQLLAHPSITELHTPHWSRLIRHESHGARVLHAVREYGVRVFVGATEQDVRSGAGNLLATINTSQSADHRTTTVTRTRTGKLSRLLREEPAWPHSAQMTPVGMTCSRGRGTDEYGKSRRMQVLRPDVENADTWTAFYRAWAGGASALECGRILADGAIACRGQSQQGRTYADLDDHQLTHAAYGLVDEPHYEQLRTRRYTSAVAVPVPILKGYRWEGYEVDHSDPDTFPHGCVRIDIPLDHPIDLTDEEFDAWRARLDAGESRARRNNLTSRVLADLPPWTDGDHEYRWFSRGSGPEGTQYYRLHRRPAERLTSRGCRRSGWRPLEGEHVLTCSAAELEAALGRAIARVAVDLGDAAAPPIVRAAATTAQRDRAKAEQRLAELPTLIANANEDLQDAQDALDRNGTTRRRLEKVSAAAAQFAALEAERERLFASLGSESGPREAQIEITSLAAIGGLLQGSGGKPMPAQLNRIVTTAIGDTLRVSPDRDDPRRGTVTATLTWKTTEGAAIAIDIAEDLALSTLVAKQHTDLGASIARRVLHDGIAWANAVVEASSTDENARNAVMRGLRTAGMPRYPKWQRSALLDCPVPETKAIAWALLTETATPHVADPGFVDLIRSTYFADCELSWGGQWAKNVALSRKALRVFQDMAGRGDDPGEGLRGCDLAIRIGASHRETMNLAGPHDSTDVRLRHVLESHPDDKRVLRPKKCPMCGQWLLHVLLVPETAAHHGLICTACRSLPDGTPLPAGYLALWDSGTNGTVLADADDYAPAMGHVPGQQRQLRIGEAARRLGITTKQLRAHANAGRIPVQRAAHGRERMFVARDIDRLRKELT